MLDGRCPRCTQPLSRPSHLVGKPGTCDKCGHAFKLPAPAATDIEPSEDIEQILAVDFGDIFRQKESKSADLYGQPSRTPAQRAKQAAIVIAYISVMAVGFVFLFSPILALPVAIILYFLMISLPINNLGHKAVWVLLILEFLALFPVLYQRYMYLK